MKMLRPRTVFLSFAIIISLLVSSQVVLADSTGAPKTVIFVADRAAIAQTSSGTDLARSAVGLVSTLSQGDSFAFIAADKPAEVLGPVEPDTSQFDVSHEQLYAGLGASLAVPPSDMVGSLVQAYNLLNTTGASHGSTIYLITGATPATDLTVESGRLGPTLDLLRASGWPVIGLRLPGASPQVVQFLDYLALESGGEAWELSPPAGFKALADMILREETSGSLAGLDDRVLSTNEVLTSPLNIAPGTGMVTLIFFKEDPYGSLRLSNPSGLESSAGDRRESSVMQTPHVVIWRLIDPTPGQWTAEVRGMEGAVSASQFASNGYTVALVPYGTVPLNQPTTLVAYVKDGDFRVALDNVRVVATISTPEGATLAHELNDEGHSGDAQAGDGYYSGAISPVTVEGSYGVELQLLWPEFGHVVSSQASFEAQGFPAIDLSPVKTDEITPGERTKVATVLVHVDGQPYGIPADRLIAQLASNVDDVGVVEVTPQRLLGEGRAWIYDVFLTVGEEGLHTLNFQLQLEYAGRQYTYASDYVVLSSVIPASPAIAATVPSNPSTPITPPTRIEPESAGFPWSVVAGVTIALAALAAAVAIYWFTRSWPYGYLYNDRDEPVVDFSHVKRSPIMRFLFKNAVRGQELGVPGLEGVLFTFSRGKIALRGKRGTPTVRVNNQPLVGRATVYERAWIGTAGRLYGLFLSSPPFEPQFSGDDD